MSDEVTYTSNDNIATITINRPERMNALNENVIVNLQAAYRRFEDSDDRVAVLHAAGDRAERRRGYQGPACGDVARRARGRGAGFKTNHRGGPRLVHRRRVLHRADV